MSGVVALLVFAVVAGLAMRREGEEESVRDARTLGAAIARGVVEPALAEGIERSEPGAVSRLDAVVRRGVLGDAVVRVKLWDRSGTIVYSDEPRLIGSRYPLGEDERGALRGDAVEAEVSELGQPENRFERSHGQLLEVYLPVTTPDGTKLLFESYQPLSSIAADGSRTWRAFAPAVLGALLLLWLVQIPLATSLARRVRNGRRDREALLLQAVAASEDERYRIAADLHDGVVQDLAGVAFTLSATADRIAPADAAAAAGLSEAAETMRTSMRRLRSLIVEIYPPNLESVGLGAALRDLVAPLFVLVVLIVGFLASFPWQTMMVLSLAYLVSLPLSWRTFHRRLAADGAAGAKATAGADGPAVGTGDGQ